MTNLEALIPRLAEQRVKPAFYKWPTWEGWVGDFGGPVETHAEAVQKETEWLMAEVENDDQPLPEPYKGE